MKTYDPSLPLIYIHIPKTAGTSTKALFKRWFGNGLYEHYFNQLTREPPAKLDLAALHTAQLPVALYGHFNSMRGFGIEQYYPEVSQFVTVLRDPFERAISNYYFLRRVAPVWHDPSRIPTSDLREHLRNDRANMFNHFPRPVTTDNYRDLIDEYFIEIGLTENLGESMRRIAMTLSLPFDPAWLLHLNPTEHTQEYPADLKAEYSERHALEMEVYEYVRSQFMARQTPGPVVEAGKSS